MMLEQDLVIILETVRVIAIALFPVTPGSSWRIYAQLGYSRDQFDATTWVSLSLLSLSHKKKKTTQILQNLVLGFELFCCAVLLKKLFCLHCRETPSGVGLRVARWWLNPNQSLLGLKTKLKWKKTKTKGLQSERPWNVRGSWNKLKKLLGLRCFSLFWILFCFHHLNVKLFLLLIHAHKYLLGTCIYARAYLCGRCIMCVYKFWMEISISYFGNKLSKVVWFKWSMCFINCSPSLPSPGTEWSGEWQIK